MSPSRKNQSEPTPTAPEGNLRPDWNQSRANGVGDINPREADSFCPRRERQSGSSEKSAENHDEALDAGPSGRAKESLGDAEAPSFRKGRVHTSAAQQRLRRAIFEAQNGHCTNLSGPAGVEAYRQEQRVLTASSPSLVPLRGEHKHPNSALRANDRISRVGVVLSLKFINVGSAVPEFLSQNR